MSRAPLDEVLLRRFGLVRAVGGAAYVAVVAVLFALFDTRVWPLALGVPVLAVVTTGYFARSHRYPRAAVTVSLAADAVVLGGAVAFLGGTGSGLVLLYTIVVVSAGILLGPRAATGFTAFTVALGLTQLAVEQLGYPPVFLHRPELEDRLPVLGVSLAGLLSIGYLSATYASRLHQLIAEAADRYESVRLRGRRRRSFVEHAAVAAHLPLRELEATAQALEAGTLDPDARRDLARRLRRAVSRLRAEVGTLADAGVLDAGEEARPQVVSLRRVCDDCLHQLAGRLEGYHLQVDVPALKVLADPRAARRVVFDLLENVADHTPAGTNVRVRALATGPYGVLAISDDGPGLPASVIAELFGDPPPDAGGPRVGLRLVRELCATMGAGLRHETPTGGGTRFLVAFRLAPSAAPETRDAVTSPAATPSDVTASEG